MTLTFGVSILVCFFPPAGKKEKKLPTSFTNLFAKTAKSSKSGDVIITAVEESGGKKEKVNHRKKKTAASGGEPVKLGHQGLCPLSIDVNTSWTYPLYLLYRLTSYEDD